MDQSREPGGSTYADDRSLRLRSEMRHQASAGAVLEFGADARVDDYGLNVGPRRLDANDLRAFFPPRTESTMGAYLSLELRPTPAILLLPGLRSDLYTSQGASKVGVDPRLLTTFRLSRSISLDQTLGLSHQRPNFIPQVPAGQVAGLKGGLQRAINYSSGVRWKLPEDISASLTAFRSSYFNAVDPIGGSRDLELDRSSADQRWTISSYGIELMLRRSLSRRLGGFLAYTLSRTQHSAGALASVTGIDRTHVLQAALGYDFGQNLRLGVRGVFYSGIAALLVGTEPPRFDDQTRGPAFFRMDVRVEKRWRWGSSGYWGLVGEVLNATASREVLRVECGQQCRSESTGPVVLPSVGVEAGY
jgi:outer membrane receptor protein involved in Fe transport